MTEPIKCEWVKIERAGWLPDREKIHRRAGRYHQSCFPSVEGYGTSRWVVCGYLDANLAENKDKGLSMKEIVDGCIEYLNRPPPRKRKPLYGALKPVVRWDGTYDVTEKGDGNLIVLFSTDQRRCKHFWGDGPVERAKEDGRKTRWKK